MVDFINRLMMTTSKQKENGEMVDKAFDATRTIPRNLSRLSEQQMRSSFDRIKIGRQCI
jgi:hypothetical protein